MSSNPDHQQQNRGFCRDRALDQLPPHARALLLLILFWWVVGLAQAVATTPVASKSGATGDQAINDAEQILVVLAPVRPLVLRLQLWHRGAGFRAAWRQYGEEFFEQLDQNRSNALEAAEAAELPWSARAIPMSRPAFWQEAERFAAPFQTRPDTRRQLAASNLFSLIDTHRDHRLTPAEIEQIPLLLARRDFDGDGGLTEAELGSVPHDSSSDKSTMDNQVLVVSGTRLTLEQAQALARHYDRDDNGQLSYIQGTRIEILLDGQRAQSLDEDHNGALSAGELATIPERLVDCHLTLTFGQGSLEPKVESKINTRPPDSARVRRRIDGGYTLDRGDVKMEVRRNNRDPSHIEKQALRFGDFDKDKNGYLDRAEVRDNPMVADVFARLDSNNDRKVFAKEFESYFYRASRLAAVQFVVAIADRGQEIFELLDENFDGQLTLRELRAARELLNTHDLDSDGALSALEIPQQFVWEISRGGIDPSATARATMTRGARRRQRLGATGPVWFQKMDANGDGDVSPQEFLGPRPAFDRLDTNRDGLLDATEAAKKHAK